MNIWPLYTVSQKKVPTFKLSVTLSNLNRFSKFLHCWKAYENCYETHDIAHLNLGMLLQHLGKSKIQISAAIQPIWKKMQATCCILIASNFVIHPQIFSA